MSEPRFLPSRSHAFITRTAGDYSLTNTTWQNLDTGLDLTVPAQVGDVLKAGISANYTNTGAMAAKLNVVTMNGSTLENYFGGVTTIGSAGSATDGIAGWFAPASTSVNIGPSVRYTVQAADIAIGGLVTVRLINALGSSGTRVLLADSLDQFQWWVENIGPTYGN